MSNPSIYGKSKPLSASVILQAAGDALSAIRHEDRLTWSDLGAILGKSEDQAAKYADGTAEMGLVAFIRAKQAFNGRFTDRLDKLTQTHATGADAHHAQSCILKAALALSEALEDGDLTEAELLANRTKLVNARDALDAQLARLCVRRVK